MGVAFVAHCLLNQNSKVGDGARCPGVYSPVVEVLRAKGWRIEQMPCPELAFTGLNRFWAVREQSTPPALPAALPAPGGRASRTRSASASGQGEDIVLIGVEGSPSMGVSITSSDPLRGGRPEWPDGAPELTSGEGIFIEELRAGTAAGGESAAPGRRRDPSAARSRRGGGARPALECRAAIAVMEGDARSFRIALVADRYVNPPPGGVDGLAVLAEAGWGVMQLPAADYPAGIAGRILAEVAEQGEEFTRHGYDIVLVGERRRAGRGAGAAWLAVPDRDLPASAAELRQFLGGRPAPPCQHRSWLAAPARASPRTQSLPRRGGTAERRPTAGRG